MSDVRKLLQGYLAVLQHKEIRPPMDPGVQERIAQEVKAYLDATADDDEPVTEDWLKKDMKAIVDEDGYHLNGLSLVCWDGDWRWQVGGTENMWELLHGQSRGVVRRLCAALGVPLAR